MKAGLLEVADILIVNKADCAGAETLAMDMEAIAREGVREEKGETKIEGDPSSKRKEDAYKDQLGRGEEYWKNRVEEWKRKSRTAQEKMEGTRIKYNELTEKFNDSKSSAERNQLRRERDQVKQEMDQYKNQLEEAKTMLERKIPEEAEIYKAKQEWIKQ